MSIAQTIIGSLAIRIGADTSALKSGLAESEKMLGGFNSKIGKTLDGITKIGLAAAVAGAALVVGLTKSSMETIDAQAELARQLGGTTAAVQTLQRQASQAGVSNEMLAKSVQTLNARLGEAMRDGATPAAEALRRLGLSAKELAKMDADERMATLADRMRGLGYSASQQADTLRELGIRSQQVFNLLEDGGDAIRNARSEIEKFGVAVSDVDAAQIDAANDSLTAVNLAFQGIGNRLAVTLSPLIEHVANLFKDAAGETGGFGDAIEKAVAKGVRIFGAFSNVFHSLRLEWDEAVSFIVDGINYIIRGWNKFASIVPGMSGLAVDEIKNDWGKLRAEIGDPPSLEDWDAWYEGVKKKSRDAAEATVAARAAMNAKGPADVDGLSSKEREALQKRLLALKQSLASEDEALNIHRQKQLMELAEFEQKGIVKKQEANAIRLKIEEEHRRAMADMIQSRLEESYLREDEILARRYEKQLADLETFEANKTITTERANEIRRRLVEQNELAMFQIRTQMQAETLNRVAGLMSSLTTFFGSEGDKQFGIAKSLSIASAVLKSYESITSAYAAGWKTGIPGAAEVYAGMAAVQTGAQIAALRGVSSRGGGGAAPSGGGSASAPSGGAESGGGSIARSEITVNGIGDVYSQKSIRQLIERINEASGDGVLIRMA